MSKGYIFQKKKKRGQATFSTVESESTTTFGKRDRLAFQLRRGRFVTRKVACTKSSLSPFTRGQCSIVTDDALHIFPITEGLRMKGDFA